MRSGWLFLLSFLLTLAVVPAFASVTYSGVTIDTVLSNGQYVARPVVLDTAGFAVTTGRVATMGGSATLPVAVRASAGAASLTLRTVARFCGPWCLVGAGAYELYQYMKSSGLTECGTQASGNNGWCVKEYEDIPSGFVCGTMGGPYAGLGVMGCYLLSISGNGGGAVCDTVNGSRSGRSEIISYFGITPPDNVSSACIVVGVGLVTRLATDADFEKVPIPMPMPLIADSWARVAGDHNLPVDAWKTVNTPTSSWLGEPYIGADGKWHRDALIFNPANSNFPAQVRVETRTFGPADDPDQLRTPNPLPDTPQDPNQPALDLCALNPTIIACAQQEDYYSRMQSGASGAVSSAAMTQSQFEESDQSFGEAIDAVGSGAPPDNSISGAESANDDLDGIIANIGSVDLPGLANIDTPSYSQCKTISFEYQSTTFLFPTASQCEKIEQIKLAFGYFLAGLVLVSLVWQLLTRPQG